MEEAAPAALRTHNLEFQHGSLAAVRDLSVCVRRGEIYGFLGRNGAGKTTTIKMLMGVLKPRAGTLQFFDQRPRRRAGLAAKRRIGYVSQQQHFYAWMDARRLGRFVAGLYPTWDHDEYARLLRVFDLPFDRRVGGLSGGMRVKLALALALTPRPDLLVLDEPMAGLDVVAQREFLDLVQDQARLHGRTTFFSSHRIHEVERISDRIGMIDHGRLIYEGTVDALRDSIRELTSSTAHAAHPLPESVEDLFESERDGARQRVVRAREADLDWSAVDLPGETIAPLNLEEAFIAMVRERTSAL